MSISNYLITNILNGLLGIFLLILGYKIFDICTPKWNFADIFKSNKITNGSIIVAAFLIGLSIIIAMAAN